MCYGMDIEEEGCVMEDDEEESFSKSSISSNLAAIPTPPMAAPIPPAPM
jgi:hypothetical protein